MRWFPFATIAETFDRLLRAKPRKRKPAPRRIQFEPLEDRHLLSATPQLVYDINTVDGGNNGSGPGSTIQIGNTVFFTATTDQNGTELWKTDGTCAGTMLVRDILPGVSNSNVQQMTNLNGTLYFRATDFSANEELWKSDGTSSGTVMVKEIRTTLITSFIQNLTNINGTLYFNANDATHGSELWRSDGTETGTYQIADLIPGTTGGDPFEFVEANGIVYFRANNLGLPPFDVELWRTDGTSSGTYLVSDINPGTAVSSPGNFLNVNGTLFFTATTAAEGQELWKTDGTSSGTVLVSDINAGISGSSPRYLRNLNGQLLFVATNTAGDRELWTSDGTSSGTVVLVDINTTASSNPSNLLRINNTFYFSATTVAEGNELWKTDGTSSGTVLVSDIAAGGDSNPQQFANVNGTLYFSAIQSADRELWKSDGTSSGTVLVKDINSGNYSNPTSLINLNGKLVFAATDATHGSELWTSDGTSSGTNLTRDIRVPQSASAPQGFALVNGITYFIASDGVNGAELWRTNGTSAGTSLVSDIRPGSTGSSLSNLTNVNGTLFFIADDGTNGAELWKSDGTSSGTVLVRDIRSGVSVGSSISNLFNLDGTLFFAATEGTNGVELWKSDGTSTGTVLAADINTGSSGSSPRYFTNVNGTLYFRATPLATGAEVWRSDGTSSGTFLVADVNPSGSSGSEPTNLTNVNGTLFFRAGITGIAEYLYRTDGTSSGTVALATFPGFPSNNGPRFITAVNDVVYFRASDGTNGYELWKSDGTTSGTLMVKDIAPGSDRSYLTNLVNVNGTLFFRAASVAATRDYELWKTDGTSSGTVQVRDIYPGPHSSQIQSLVNHNGTLFFAAALDGGLELWTSDGTSSGTVQVGDINAGAAAANVTNIFSAGNALFFSADNGTGTELFALNTVQPTVSLSVTGSPLAENGGTATVVATLSEAYFQPVTVNLGFSGTATNNTDYSASSNTIVILAGQTSGSVTLTGIADLTFEGDESIIVDVTSVTNGTENGTQSITATITDAQTLNLGPVNTVPGAKTVNEDTLLAVTGISITDPDAGTANVSVTFSVAHGNVNVLGSVASGVTSGQISGNGSSSVTITAPLAAINATLADATGLRYQGVLNYNGTDALTVSTNDLGNTGSGGALVDTDTIGITVNPVNDNPVNTLPTINTNEDTPRAVTGFSISDVDSTGPFSVNVRFNNTVAGTLMLRTDVPSGLTSGNILNNGTPNLTILGASLGAINTTLGNASGLIYTPTANFNGFALFAVDTNSDGNGGSDVGDTAIWTVTAVNDAPVNTIPSSLSTNEDTAVAITGISISDVDAGAATMRVTLTAANGVLNLSSTVVSGVTAGQITGSGTGTVTINASIAAINTTLANASGLSFSPTADYNGPTTVTVVTNDLTNTGLGGALTDTDTINITVSAVNDGPTNSVPASATVAANVAMAITGISISDIDSGTANISVTLTAASGTLNVLTNAGGGVTGGQITNNGTGTVTITAPIANINATLASATGVTYQGALNFTGTVNLTVTTNDLGNIGSGSALTDTDTVAITVTEVNATLAILGSPFAENGGIATVRATLSNPPPQNVTVNLGFNGTATNNTDYSASANVITILAGQTSGSITLTGIDDALSETVESIIVDVTSVTNGTENGVQQATAYVGNVLPAVVATNTPANVVDPNRYSVSGSTLTINGTSGDDTIGFVRIDATSFYTYFGNELVVFSTAAINQVNIVSGAGTDTFTPAGASTVTETVTLGYKSLSLTSTGLTLQSDTEVNIPRGQLADSVTLNDSTGNDLLYLLPSYAYMWNPTVGDYKSWPVGFGTVTANASTGTDTLLFYGEAGPQTFTMGATQSSLTSGGRTLTANNFEQQYAYGSTGDVANLTGTAANDVFFRIDPYMILVTAGGWQEAIGFPEVNVASGGGVDAAVFYDSTGDDTFTGSPTQATFQTNVDLARVNNFRNVYAFATTGNDTATLAGSSGNDVFYGGRTASTLSSSSPGYLLQALAFDTVHANLATGSGGNDQAFLDDGPGVDTLTAQNNFAELVYLAGNRVRVTAFDTVYARGTGGGVNQRTVTNPLLYSLIFTGSWA